MKKEIFTFWSVGFVFVFVFILFSLFFFKGFIPMPADITVGLYYPWLDYKWGYAVGVPVKNPLLSDIPSLLYPWRSLVVDQLKNLKPPLWNPFYFNGMPLLANFQAAVFSWVNIFFLFLPKIWAWSLGVIVQPFLAVFFTYLFLRNKKLTKSASLLAGIVFSLSGFSVAWMEYNVHGHTGYFLPLLLFLVDKYFGEQKTKWLLGISLAVAFQIFAGYIPIVIYSYLIIGLYILWVRKAWPCEAKGQAFLKLGFFWILGLGLAAVQLLPGWELVKLSIRNIDPTVRASNASFLPLRHLVTMLVPDFFGNPATHNYWGQAFYDNFAFWVGPGVLILVLVALLKAKSNGLARFWGLTLLFSFLLATRNSVGIFLQKVLFLEGGVAARALFITDFSLAILAGLGLESLMKEKRKALKQLVVALVLVGGMMGVIGVIGIKIANPINRIVALRNLIVPVGVFLLSIPLLLGLIFYKRKLFLCFYVFMFLCLISGNLLYHAKKYLPFSKPELVFPTTPVIGFLRSQPQPFRFEPGEVIPQNMWMPFKLETASGSDAVLPKRMGEFLTAVETGKIQKDISRVHLIRNYDSPLFPLLNVKYILAKKKTEMGIYSPEGKPPPRFLDESKYHLVFEDKTVQIYEDLGVLPRAFLVYDFEVIEDGSKIIKRMQSSEFDFEKKIILEESPNQVGSRQARIAEEMIGSDKIKWLNNQPGDLGMSIESDQPSFLFLANNFYPGWKVFVDGVETKIYRANYTFQAIAVPKGEHTVEFIYDPLSFKLGLMISLLSAGGFLGVWFWSKRS